MKSSVSHAIVLFVILLSGPWSMGQTRTPEKLSDSLDSEQIVVFVCEHGAAKSIVAAAYFNKLARERNLRFRAIARGTTPQDEIAVSASKGLQADGLTVTEQKPVELTRNNVTKSFRVVTFCALPEDYYRAARVEEWNDVPSVGDDYKKARDIILDHIERLINDLQSKK